MLLNDKLSSIYLTKNEAFFRQQQAADVLIFKKVTLSPPSFLNFVRCEAHTQLNNGSITMLPFFYK